MCVEFADKIVIIFAVLKQRFLQRRETEASFCYFYNFPFLPADILFIA